MSARGKLAHVYFFIYLIKCDAVQVLSTKLAHQLPGQAIKLIKCLQNIKAKLTGQ